MSLEVISVSKQYGSQWAVADVSFALGKGEIVGFLGPNGAGKSTTMKMATGFLAPTKGEIVVAGFNVRQQSLEARRVIGYLAEHNPLYTDMFVTEYLRFCGKIFGMRGNALREAVETTIERCGLQPERHKKIEALSKGYRQRVGLAQAMLHNPQVLILDEPTTGLDPNQLVEIRNLIKEISREKTVILSTHIMQEVEALCKRVMIINKGKLVADSPLEALVQQDEAGSLENVFRKLTSTTA